MNKIIKKMDKIDKVLFVIAIVCILISGFSKVMIAIVIGMGIFYMSIREYIVVPKNDNKSNKSEDMEDKKVE